MNLTIDAYQRYLSARYGGEADEQGLFMKLVEEIGEIAEILNKKTGRKAGDDNSLQEQLGFELADALHYIVALAAVDGLDLQRMVLEKDKLAAAKYQPRNIIMTPTLRPFFHNHNLFFCRCTAR